jgi:soluble lytic murein transglycosylase-like protein
MRVAIAIAGTVTSFILRRVRKRPTLLIPVLLLMLFGYGLHRLALGRNTTTPPLRQLSSVFTPEVRHWSPLIFAWASAYNIDPNLIATVIQIESCGDPNAVSSSGAQGLFQVMPFHFREGEDMQEILTNGKRGMDYLAGALKLANGDAGLALAGYNGGHGLIRRDQDRWPAETKRYYYWGSGIYEDAKEGQSDSTRMQEWLSAGGKSLCKQASRRQTVVLK